VHEYLLPLLSPLPYFHFYMHLQTLLAC
jgi:hypothetical protein